MSTVQQYLPIKDDEREFFTELRVKVTLGWERSPIYEAMVTSWLSTHVTKMTRAQLIEKLTAVHVEIPRGPSGKPATKVELARAFALYMVGVIGV